MAAIYAPIDRDSAISFELVPPTVTELAERICSTTAELPWLAAETDDGVVGYPYGGVHRARAAYPLHQGRAPSRH
jgi:phosphinothricin acetyltransferase